MDRDESWARRRVACDDDHRSPPRARGHSSAGGPPTQLGRMSLRPRRLNIGLGIGGDSVRAVVLSAGKIAWAAERSRGDEPLTRTLERILADAPIVRWRRPRVIAAVGPAHAQTKRLVGLPPVGNQRSEERRVGEECWERGE